jgi:hypothetical protein
MTKSSAAKIRKKLGTETWVKAPSHYVDGHFFDHRFKINENNCYKFWNLCYTEVNRSNTTSSRL